MANALSDMSFGAGDLYMQGIENLIQGRLTNSRDQIADAILQAYNEIDGKTEYPDVDKAQETVVEEEEEEEVTEGYGVVNTLGFYFTRCSYEGYGRV